MTNFISAEKKEKRRFRTNVERVNNESGIALVLVLFVLSLSAILVTQLTHSSTLDMRLHLIAKRSIEAEYLLKSAVNFGRAIIREDTSPEDAMQDPWGVFRNGLEIPKELLQIDDPTVKIEIEIRPEESKLPITILRRYPSDWQEVFLRLFQELGFDDDGETDESGLFPGREFSSEEMVANLIDYMDDDNESYQSANFASGIESELPDDTFRNGGIKWIGELYFIPGFTTKRIREMSPYITKWGNKTVNINLAPPIVLRSLDDEMGAAEVDEIIAFRNEQPFDATNRKTILEPIVGETIYNRLTRKIGVQSRYFQIIAKVDYGASSVFMRAYVHQEQDGDLPQIRSAEIFS